MNIFGDFYSKPIEFKSSKKEKIVASSENWSAAVLSGSSEQVSKEEPLRRSVLFGLMALLVLCTGVLVWRLFGLQIIQGQEHAVLANGNRVRTTVIPAPRGAIYDRGGTLLARNNAQFDLIANPAQLPHDKKDRQAEATKLAGLVGKSSDEMFNIINKTLDQDQQTVVLVEKLSRDQALNVDEISKDIPGISIETSPQREYLDGGSLSQFMGYIGRISAEEWQAHPQYRQVDVIGKSGIEKAYEDDLKGAAGKEQIEVDATGLPVRYLARQEPQAGNNVYLSIDWGLQQKMQSVVQDEISKAGGKAGAAVALNPQTGEVLAAVNYPNYDGNLFAKGISQADYNTLLNNDANPLFNRVMSGNYPIGSTIKPFISVAGLQEGVINSGTTIVDRGKLDVPNIYNPSIVYTFKGWKPEGLGPVNVVRALQWSSDIFYYEVGGGFEGFQGLGAKRLLDWYSRFGFGHSTGSDLTDESAGSLPSPEQKEKLTHEPWSVGDTYNISIGQGDFRATPLQLAVATAAIANGGKLLKPHFVTQVKNTDGSVVKQNAAEVVNPQIASPATISLVQQGMEAAVSGGTACCIINSEVPVKVAGKTGTAETSSQGFDGKNPTTKPHAWFTAYAPADNPRIVTVVLIEHSGEGAEFAVPATREILKWYFTNR